METHLRFVNEDVGGAFHCCVCQDDDELRDPRSNFVKPVRTIVDYQLKRLTVSRSTYFQSLEPEDPPYIVGKANSSVRRQLGARCL